MSLLQSRAVYKCLVLAFDTIEVFSLFACQKNAQWLPGHATNIERSQLPPGFVANTLVSLKQCSMSAWANLGASGYANGTRAYPLSTLESDSVQFIQQHYNES